MDTNQTTPGKRSGGIDLAEVERLLPATYYVKRGDLQRAFGFSRHDLDALIPGTFLPAPVTAFKRHRFVRSQVIAVARSWAA